ncbi:MAG: hypothetical protein K8R48_02020 [Alphaproteobacteria bacterium]|nr:hypothetical protein [Alphaproteobacteria bacterium]
MLHISLRTSLAVFVVATALSGCTPDNKFHAVSAGESGARSRSDGSMPSLVITTEQPAPSVVFRRGSHDTVLASPDAGTPVRVSSLKSQHIETPVTQKAAELNDELGQMRGKTTAYSRRLQELQNNGDAQSAAYYTLVASINADLQTGTTPGNPILVDRWNTAQDKLNALSQSASQLNTLAMDLSYHASSLSFLLESTQAAFALSGAVDEDHKKLTGIEDNVNQDLVATNRLMLMVNDDLSRRSSYLRTERGNLQTLSLAIANGELYGQNLTNGVFKRAAAGDLSLNKTGADAGTPAALPARKPLVIIRFDHPNVNYDQPLYTAISQALEKYPAAKFDLVAVSMAEGNPAKMAMSSSDARKNGEAVLRAMIKMGLPIERVGLSAANSKNVLNSEVHIYIQ